MILYIYNSETINQAVKNICPREWKSNEIEEFKQFFYLQICEMETKKLIKAYDNGYIDGVCIRVILNHIRSKYSLFTKIYKRNGFTGGNIIQGNVPTKTPETGMDGILNERRDTLYFNPEDDFWEDIEDEKDPYKYMDMETINKRIEEIIFGLHWYEKTLWNMKNTQNLSLKEISKTTGINYNSIYYSLNKTKKTIKEILLKEFPENFQ